jgi:hypothetical protein
MNCRQAKADIALWIGDDLPDRSRREELRRHVVACPGCRKHYKRLKGTLQVLEHADREQTYDASDSVWPELSRRIERHAHAGGRRPRFNGWFPFVAMTAACLALVVTMNPDGSPGVPSHDGGLRRGMLELPTFGRSADLSAGVTTPTAATSPSEPGTTLFRDLTNRTPAEARREDRQPKPDSF